MGLQYRQLLVSRDKDYAPRADVVSRFLSEIAELGVVPGQPEIVLRVPSGKTREYRNPVTGGKIVVNLKDNTRLNTLQEFEGAARGMMDFEVLISGEGRPRLPPLRLDFADP